MLTTFLIILLIVLGAVIFVLQQMMQGVDAKNLTLEDRVEVAENEIADLRKKAAPYLKNLAELDKLLRRIDQLTDEKLNLENEKLNNDLIDLNVYRRELTYKDPMSFQLSLKNVWQQQDEMIKGKIAAIFDPNKHAKIFIIASTTEEKKMIDNLIKLAIRTFNGESDVAIGKVKWNNFEQMKDKILKSESGIEKMLDKWGITIADTYRNLKIQELLLTYKKAELDEKIQEEQRIIREEKREEEKAIREAETAQRKAEQEEEKINTALAKAKSEMANTHSEDITKHLAKIKELESRLLEAEQNRIRAISQAQLTRSGNVYIISNPGSFGENVYKIGMTRRLDPMDRIWELSDASVPFDFDVHGIIKSDDAPKLESKFHTMFQKNKINLVNNRKEFFRISIHDIQEVCHKEGLDIKLTLAAEAKEWFESESIRKTIK